MTIVSAGLDREDAERANYCPLWSNQRMFTRTERPFTGP